ncbi:MAG: hypothetical protein IJS50_01545, partial [Desulfovibrio sp.]|nr:hypothetical protein [Desulfovibrio sp.]
MKGLRIFLRSEEPMILSDGKTDGFIQTTLDYIAGNKFLGFLTTEWKKKHPKEEPLNSPEFRALFLDGAVSFGNA